MEAYRRVTEIRAYLAGTKMTVSGILYGCANRFLTSWAMRFSSDLHIPPPHPAA